MVWELDGFWMLAAIASVTILSFMLAMFLNAVTGPQVFGPGGNAAVMTGGFFAGLAALSHWNYHLDGLHMIAMAGIACAFGLLLMLGLVKALVSRL